MTQREYREHILMLPRYMQDGMLRWIEKGVPGGDFMRSVVSNDLFGAVSHADSTNRTLLPVYVRYLYNWAPRGCWGSPKKVAAWAAHQGLKGKDDAAS